MTTYADLLNSFRGEDACRKAFESFYSISSDFSRGSSGAYIDEQMLNCWVCFRFSWHKQTRLIELQAKMIEEAREALQTLAITDAIAPLDPQRVMEGGEL